MNLRPRLQAIADLIPPSRRIADIGTDHGYIPLYLVQQDKADSAIATDISAGSLDKADELIQQYNMHHCMETRRGNGLSILSVGEADTIIIAGMGGVLIRDIIQQGEKVARQASTLVLQPMVGQEELRRWLLGNGYDITDEELVREGRRIYEIIVAVPNTAAREYENEIYYKIGWKLIEKNHPLLDEWMQKKILGLEQMIASLERGQTDSAVIRLRDSREKLRQFKEVYRCHIR